MFMFLKSVKKLGMWVFLNATRSRYFRMLVKINEFICRNNKLILVIINKQKRIMRRLTNDGSGYINCWMTIKYESMV
jgi:hypothetical protein